MKKIVILPILVALTAFQLSAQQLPKRIDAWQPQYIQKTNGTPQGIGQNETWQRWCERQIKSGNLGKNTDAVWTVYSDRCDNPAYASSSTSSAVVRRLAFGEKFFVAQVSNGMLLLFSDKYAQDKYPKFNKTAKVVGWVPVENLILYEECPKTQSQIYLKGLVVYDPTKSKEKDSINPRYRLSPDGSKLAPKAAKDLDILFIMKKVSTYSGNYYLLSNSMNCHNSQSTLLGWLPEEYVTEWTQRLVLEPTHSSTAVREYAAIGKKPSVSVKESDAENYWRSGALSAPIWVYSDFSTKRQYAYEMRLPILDKTTNEDIYQIAVMNNLATKGKSVPDKALLEAELEKLRANQSKINVIFVIDATNSMEKYYKSVVDALTDVMHRDYFKDANIKVGCVLYRDYKDHAAKGIEYQKCTDDVKSISSYLSQVKVGSIDIDDWEALFDGLEVALDTLKMGYSSKESNFIILVGDAGNHPKDNVTEKLAGKMASNRINFLAYQINHAGHDAYYEFADQVGEIQKSLSKEYEAVFKCPEGTMDYRLVSNRFYRLVRKRSEKADVPVYNMYSYAEKGHSESASGLTKIISSNIEDFQKWVNDRILMLENALNGGGMESGGDVNTDQITEYLRMNGWSEKQISNYIEYMKRGGTGKFISYTPMKIRGMRNDLYDYVLFFSGQELENLLHALDEVNKNAADDRKAYQDAVMAMGQAILGNFSASKIGEMTMEELMSQIYGVPIKMHSCGFRIDQIINIEPSELQKLMTDFKGKLSGLHAIKDNSYDGRFAKNGIHYYWIPLDMMPGYCTDKR